MVFWCVDGWMDDMIGGDGEGGSFLRGGYIAMGETR